MLDFASDDSSASSREGLWTDKWSCLVNIGCRHLGQTTSDSYTIQTIRLMAQLMYVRFELLFRHQLASNNRERFGLDGEA